MQVRSRLGKFFLSRWKFFEENINEFPDFEHNIHRRNAIHLFTCLQKLEQEEITLLACRWYNASEGTLYNAMYDTYETYKPVPYEVVAEEYDTTVCLIQIELRNVEKKLGALLYKEIHGREWDEEPPKRYYCASCDTFKEHDKQDKCIDCGNKRFDVTEYLEELHNNML